MVSAFLSKMRFLFTVLAVVLFSSPAFAGEQEILFSDLLPHDASESVNQTLNGKEILLSGFVVPLERDEENRLTELLLVPYFGACIHMPPPPENQIVHIFLKEAVDCDAMDIVTVHGRIETEKKSYVMRAASLEKEDRVSRELLWAIFFTFLCGASVSLGFIGPFARIAIAGTVLSFALSFASGILSALGIGTIVAKPSLENGMLFLLGFLFSLFFCLRKKDHGRQNGTLAFALALHNFPECTLVFLAALTDIRLGFFLSLAMLLHNAPLGISLGLAIEEASKAKRFWYAILSGVFPPLLALLFAFFLKNVLSQTFFTLLMVTAGGILLGLALFGYLPHAREHGTIRQWGSGFILGVLFLECTMLFLSFRTFGGG